MFRMIRRRLLNMPGRHLQGDAVDDLDPSLQGLLVAAYRVEMLAAEAPKLDVQCVWARIEPRLAPQRARRWRLFASPAPRTNQEPSALKRLVQPSWPNLARATAAALMLTVVLVTSLWPTDRTANAEFLDGINAVAALNQSLSPVDVERAAHVASLDRNAARLVALLDEHPGILAGLSAEELARAHLVIETARTLLLQGATGTGSVDAGLLQRTLANLQEIAVRVAGVLTADLLGSAPPVAPLTSTGDTRTAAEPQITPEAGLEPPPASTPTPVPPVPPVPAVRPPLAQEAAADPEPAPAPGEDLVLSPGEGAADGGDDPELKGEPETLEPDVEDEAAGGDGPSTEGDPGGGDAPDTEGGSTTDAVSPPAPSFPGRWGGAGSGGE